MGLFNLNDMEFLEGIKSDARKARLEFDFNNLIKSQNKDYKMDFNQVLSAIDSFRRSIQKSKDDADNSIQYMKPFENFHGKLVNYCIETNKNDDEFYHRIVSSYESIKTDIKQKETEQRIKIEFLNWLNEWECEVQSKKETSLSN
jgi:septal ring factor EnvC (AmiA/AmiB activator)